MALRVVLQCFEVKCKLIESNQILILTINRYLSIQKSDNFCQKSSDHLYSVRNFPPSSHFSYRNENINPFSFHKKLNRYPNPLVILKGMSSSSSAIHMPCKQHCFMGEGILYFVYSIYHRKFSKTFGRHCR